MSPPKFSVVIPTRNRAETLAFALRTCLEQEFDDFEVIVSDNDGTPATREVVESAASPRCRYVRTPRLLSMSANWEFAVSQARGEYVLLIGDDDALLPHALPELDRLTREHRPRALRWTAAYYSWPTIAVAGQGDYLRVPMGRGIREVESREAVEEVLAFRACYTTLPMLYNAVVHRDLIADVRQRAGRVFPHRYPDVFSAFAFAFACGRYWSTDVPMAIAGQSGNSFGIANIFHRGRSPQDLEFQSTNDRDGMCSDPRVPDLSIFPYSYVAESFLAAKRFFPDVDGIDLDRRKLAEWLIRGLRTETQGDWQAAVALIGASLQDEPALYSWFQTQYADPLFNPAPLPRIRPERLGRHGAVLHLDATQFGVRDVAGAAAVCESILNYRRDGVAYDEAQAPHANEAAFRDSELLAAQAREIKQIHLVCEERLALIKELDRVCRDRLVVIQVLKAAIDRHEQAAAVSQPVTVSPFRNLKTLFSRLLRSRV